MELKKKAKDASSRDLRPYNSYSGYPAPCTDYDTRSSSLQSFISVTVPARLARYDACASAHVQSILNEFVKDYLDIRNLNTACTIFARRLVHQCGNFPSPGSAGAAFALGLILQELLPYSLRSLLRFLLVELAAYVYLQPPSLLVSDGIPTGEEFINGLLRNRPGIPAVAAALTRHCLFTFEQDAQARWEFSAAVHANFTRITRSELGCIRRLVNRWRLRVLNIFFHTWRNVMRARRLRISVAAQRAVAEMQHLVTVKCIRRWKLYAWTVSMKILSDKVSDVQEAINSEGLARDALVRKKKELFADLTRLKLIKNSLEAQNSRQVLLIETKKKETNAILMKLECIKDAWTHLKLTLFSDVKQCSLGTIDFRRKKLLELIRSLEVFVAQNKESLVADTQTTVNISGLYQNAMSGLRSPASLIEMILGFEDRTQLAVSLVRDMLEGGNLDFFSYQNSIPETSSFVPQAADPKTHKSGKSLPLAISTRDMLNDWRNGFKDLKRARQQHTKTVNLLTLVDKSDVWRESALYTTFLKLSEVISCGAEHARKYVERSMAPLFVSDDWSLVELLYPKTGIHNITSWAHYVMNAAAVKHVNTGEFLLLLSRSMERDPAWEVQYLGVENDSEVQIILKLHRDEIDSLYNNYTQLSDCEEGIKIKEFEAMCESILLNLKFDITKVELHAVFDCCRTKTKGTETITRRQFDIIFVILANYYNPDPFENTAEKLRELFSCIFK